MGSEIPLKLPVVDFSNLDLNGSSAQWDAVRSQVYKALVEFGCFEVLFDRVPSELRKATFASLEELFDLPLQTKQQNVSLIPFNGYIRAEKLPLYESMGIGDANVIDKLDSFTNIMWPQGNPSFSKTIQSISENLSVLDQITRKMVLESLGVEKYMEEHLNSTHYLLRVMKYKAPQTMEKKLGIRPHTDKNTITILYQNLIEGLVIQINDGNWINYKPSPNSFIVLVGESFNLAKLQANMGKYSHCGANFGKNHRYGVVCNNNIVFNIAVEDCNLKPCMYLYNQAWTNGRLYPPKHQVMMSGNEVRYSLALFSTPKEGYLVKAPEELVDEKHPLLFKPFDYFEFLKFFATEEGRKVDSLSAYCGV